MPNKENERTILNLQLLNAEKPEAFQNRAIAVDFFKNLTEEKEIDKLEHEYLEKAHKVLIHPSITKLARSGEITFGMIKPNTFEGKNLGIDQSKPIPAKDELAANKIKREILRETDEGMGEILIDISITLDPEHIDLLYPELEEQIGCDRYQVFKKFMTSGPSTLLVIRHSKRDSRPEKEGIKYISRDAVNFWRTRMGATRPENAVAGSIRKRFARSIDNNLVHGSDSKKSAEREINAFGQILGSFLHAKSTA